MNNVLSSQGSAEQGGGRGGGEEARSRANEKGMKAGSFFSLLQRRDRAKRVLAGASAIVWQKCLFLRLSFLKRTRPLAKHPWGPTQIAPQGPAKPRFDPQLGSTIQSIRGILTRGGSARPIRDIFTNHPSYLRWVPSPPYEKITLARLRKRLSKQNKAKVLFVARYI